MELTKKDKVRLATELCGLTKTIPAEHIPKDVSKGWEMYQKNGQNYCGVLDFDPVNNWNHMRLVLEGLVEKEAERDFENSAWHTVLDKIAITAYMDTDFNFASAICAAGLEVLKQKGGG